VTIELSTLGPVALRDDRSALLAGRRKVLALLAYLAHVENPVSRTDLARRFWPTSNEARAKQSLRQALSELRNAVGDALEVQPDQVTLHRDSLALDSRRFAEEISNESWASALACWQGEFLTGLEDVGDHVWRDWLRQERAVYAEQFHRARVATGEQEIVAAPMPAATPATDHVRTSPTDPGSQPRDFSLGLLGTLSTDARAVIETAAVIGVHSPGCLLRSVTSLSEAGFESALSELAAREMLMASPRHPGEYEFAGATTRLRVYNVTAAYRRQAIHAQVSQALADGVVAGALAEADAAEHARLAVPAPGQARSRMTAIVLGLVAVVVAAAAYFLLR
jgi:hypothetical protein